MTELRADLPRPIPAAIQALPRDARGFPVPFFAQRQPVDFRVIRPGALGLAISRRLCWVCGKMIRTRRAAFVIGPMCAITRTSAEPPCHIDCADWSARACPFLIRPKMKRNEKDLPADAVDPAGIAIKRNPGVALVWVSDNWQRFRPPGGGVLWDVGEPTAAQFYAHGRPATGAEVAESIRTGLPILEAAAQAQGPAAVAELAARLAWADRIMPGPTG